MLKRIHRGAVLVIAACVLLLIAIIEIYQFAYTWPLSGVGPHAGSRTMIVEVTSTPQSAATPAGAAVPQTMTVEAVEEPPRTAWDLLSLLLIPLALAVAGISMEIIDRRGDRLLAEEGRRDDVLQDYLDKMRALILDNSLGTERGDGRVDEIARALTLSSLRQLDGPRKGEIVRFLSEAALLHPFEEDGRQFAFAAISLRGADLSNSDLNGARLYIADLTEADLRGANLANADLRGAILNGANISGASLLGADLRGTIAIALNATGAKLNAARFDRANLSGSDFSYASIRNGSLSDTLLDSVVFRSADMTEADLSRATGENVDMTSANLTRANLDGVTMRSAHLCYARLTYCRLTRADLSGSDMRNAILSNAQMATALLMRANLREANLSDADLFGADLEGADLSWAILDNAALTDSNLSGTILANAIVLRLDWPSDPQRREALEREIRSAGGRVS